MGQQQGTMTLENSFCQLNGTCDNNIGKQNVTKKWDNNMEGDGTTKLDNNMGQKPSTT